MNCRIEKTGERIEVHITLSDRNLSALEVSRKAIERLTHVNETPVFVTIRSESNEVHYYSEDRDKDAIGEAGGLHRLGDYVENEGHSVMIPERNSNEIR